MTEKLVFKKLEVPGLKGEEVKIEFGEIEEYWAEPQGPTPMPGITDLRDWDFKLLKRYPPLYTPICDMCCFCAYGKCDLTKDKRGACGIDQKSQQGRRVALESIIGATCHGAHAAHLVEEMIKRYGRDYPIDLGKDIEIEAPIFRVIVGSKPKTIGDLEKGVKYAEQQLMNLTASIHAGQEGSYLDRESKAMHAGMLDDLLLEIGDVAQIVGYNFPKGEINVPLIQLGPGTIDKTKPVITCIGHNVMPAAEAIAYMEEHNLINDVELAGVCCTAHDMARRNSKVKIVGNLSKQLKFIETGISDVVMTDEQCVREDIIEVAKKFGTVIIATNDKLCLGLENRTKDNPDEVVNDLVSGKVPGVLILDSEKAGEVAVKTAVKLKPLRKLRLKGLFTEEDVIEWAKKCTACEACQRTCPVNLHISSAMKKTAKGALESFKEIKELCVGCMRCNYACEMEIPITTVMESAYRIVAGEDKGNVRTGRGPITDVEIRNIGRPVVFGEIPGVIVFAGCSNVPNSSKEIAEMAEEFLKRRYIVVTTGCAAMAMGEVKDKEGKTLYEKYPGECDAGGLLNLGSCVSNAHALGAAIKVAHIFAKRNLRGNFEEIADYIHNRVPAVVVVWGTYSQKAHAICTGVARWGIPILYGPSGLRYTRLFVGNKNNKESWQGYNARSGEKVTLEPCPDELITIAETKEEAIVKIAKLCIRSNDSAKGRLIKLTHYIDLHKKLFKSMPGDLHYYVRNEHDLPITGKDEILKVVKDKGWKEREELSPTVLDPTLVERLVRKSK